VQEINLYQPATKSRGALSARSTTTWLVSVAVVLAGIWGFASWQIRSLGAEVEVVRRQYAVQAALAAQNGPQLDALSQEELDQMVVNLEAEVANKNLALAKLRAEAANSGFSNRLGAFGRRAIEGVWLEELTLGATPDSISIAGSTLAPDYVPRYLRSLAADAALKGGQIDEFIIEKPKASAGKLTFRAGRKGLKRADTETDSDAGAAGEKT
jgi:hypothetical protein